MEARSPGGDFSKADVKQYRDNGFVVVRRIYSADEMVAWKRFAVEAAAAHGGGVDNGVTVWMAPDMPPFLRRRAADSHVVAALRKLVGENIEFLSAKTVIKDGRVTYASPWHRDREYWEGSPKLSIWIALDEARRDNGCLRLIPGSHREVFQSSFRENTDNGFGHRISSDQLEGFPIVDVEAAAGDAVFFSDRTVHGSHPNDSGHDRWSFISTYRDASVIDASTTWKSAWVLAGRSVNVGSATGSSEEAD